jgi:hypothetical protein
MQTIKGILFITAVILLVILGYNFCNKIIGNTKLKPDNVNLFSTENDLLETYPFVKNSFVGYIIKDNIENFIKLDFLIQPPSQSILQNLAKATKKENISSKNYNKIIDKIKASIKMRMPIVCLSIGNNDKLEIPSNIYKFNFKEFKLQDFMFSDSFADFDMLDNHKFMINQSILSHFYYEFDNDFKTCKITSLDNNLSKQIGLLKRVDLYDKFDLNGYYHLNFKLIGFVDPSMLNNIESYISNNIIKYTAQVYFNAIGFKLGKLILNGKTYNLNGYREQDNLKLFASDEICIQVNKNYMATSNILYKTLVNNSIDNLKYGGIYLTKLEKVSMSVEKEKEIISNYDRLGNVTSLNKYSPESWAYYEDIQPIIVSDDELIIDDDFFKLLYDSITLKNILQRKYNINAYDPRFNPAEFRKKILSSGKGSYESNSSKQITKKKKKNNLSDIMGE